MNGIAEQVGGKDFVGAVHEIARAWTIQECTRQASIRQEWTRPAWTRLAWTKNDGPETVLQWARTRPNFAQRTWALIGMAEALGHARGRG
jgi:hypothetical protein